MSRLADTKDVNQKAEGSGFSLLKRQRSRTSASRLLPSAFLLLPAVLFLAVFFLLPLTRILAFSLDASALTAANFRRAFSVLRFTFYQATLSTLLTFLLGLPSAVLFARFDFRGKSLLRALTAIPFMLPTVVVAAGFNALLGPRGLFPFILHLSSFLFPPPSFQFSGTLTAILVAHVFYNTTIVIRIFGNALTNLDPRLEQAARTLGADGLRVWTRVLLPVLRVPLLAAGLLVFLFDFSSFGVVLLLGGPQFSTLEVEIYIQSMQFLNLPMAALLSIIQLLCTLAFSILYTRIVTRSIVPTAPRPSVARRPKTLREKIFVSAFCLLLSAFFIFPIISLPLRSLTRLEADLGQRGEVRYGFTGDYYRELFVNRSGSVFYIPPIEAARNSLGYAAATVALSLALGLPAASALVRPNRAAKLLDSFLLLPLGASAVTLGLGYIITFNKQLPITNYQSLIASPLIIPLAHTVIALPFVIRTLQPALASVPERLRQAAATLGASPLRVWQAVDWPILSRAVLAAATFAFTVSLGEFGAASLLARPDFPTLPVAIARFLSQPGGLNYGQAMAMSTLLMSVTLLGILLIEKARLPGAGEF
ncbi:MAG TPA: iron ABC transporter permease [Anaerolineales bacterium]|nr:iron ABC transporter permease [Anaerolineales bacterium]